MRNRRVEVLAEENGVRGMGGGEVRRAGEEGWALCHGMVIYSVQHSERSITRFLWRVRQVRWLPDVGVQGGDRCWARVLGRGTGQMSSF